MSSPELESAVVPTAVEVHHQEKPDQFRQLLAVEAQLTAEAGEADTADYLRDNLFVYMSAVAQEAGSTDPEVRMLSQGTPHQLTYMQLLRTIGEAGSDYQRGLSGGRTPTVYHYMFTDMLARAEQTDGVPSEPQNLLRHLHLAALHHRVINEHRGMEAVSDLRYLRALEAKIITPLAEEALASERPIHPSLAEAHDQPEALSVLVRARAAFTPGDELPNLI